jgi:hypothetical protein
VSEDGGVTDERGATATAPASADPDRWSFFPPPGDYGTPSEPLPIEALLRPVLPHALTFGVTTAVLVLLGAPLALVWRVFAPAAAIQRTPDGPQPVAPESNQMFAVDGRFVLVSVVAGLLLGVLAYLLLRDRGPAAPFGLAVGGLLAAGVAATVGDRLVIDPYLYGFCSRGDVECLVYTGTLRLNSTPAVVVLPVALLVAFVGMLLFSDDG